MAACETGRQLVVHKSSHARMPAASARKICTASVDECRRNDDKHAGCKVCAKWGAECAKTWRVCAVWSPS